MARLHLAMAIVTFRASYTQCIALQAATLSQSTTLVPSQMFSTRYKTFQTGRIYVLTSRFQMPGA